MLTLLLLPLPFVPFNWRLKILSLLFSFLQDVDCVCFLKRTGTLNNSSESGSQDKVGCKLVEGWIDGVSDGFGVGCILVEGWFDGLVDG